MPDAAGSVPGRTVLLGQLRQVRVVGGQFGVLWLGYGCWSSGRAPFGVDRVRRVRPCPPEPVPAATGGVAGEASWSRRHHM